MAEKGGGLGGSFGGETNNQLPTDRSQTDHIFGEREGHLPDTPKNRQRIMELVNDDDYRLGTTAHELTWYAKILEDGSQLWASVRNGVVQNCGVNNPPHPWDSKTGLSHNPKKDNN